MAAMKLVAPIIGSAAAVAAIVVPTVHAVHDACDQPPAMKLCEIREPHPADNPEHEVERPIAEQPVAVAAPGTYPRTTGGTITVAP
jgi:hypothetical protein